MKKWCVVLLLLCGCSKVYFTTEQFDAGLELQQDIQSKLRPAVTGLPIAGGCEEIQRTAAWIEEGRKEPNWMAPSFEEKAFLLQIAFYAQAKHCDDGNLPIPLKESVLRDCDRSITYFLDASLGKKVEE